VNLAPIHRSRDNLRRPAGVVAPGTHVDTREAAIARREQRGVPAEQALRGKRRAEVGRGVQHHLHHAVDMPVDRGERANVHTQAARQRGAHRFDVEVLALDLAGLDHVVGQCGQAGLFAQRQAHISQAAEQQALGTAGFGQRGSQRREVIAPLGPVGRFPDVELFSAFHAEIVRVNRRITCGD
jgi:hypothetical protein